MKRAFRVGLILGFISGILVGLTMDLLFKDSLGGTWSQAVSHDLTQILGRPVNPDSPLVILGVIFLIALIGIIGSFIGGVVGIFLYRLFTLLKT